MINKNNNKMKFMRSWCVCLNIVIWLNLLVVTDGLSVPSPARRACVLGAGYAGLGTARYLKQYGVNFTVFEASRHVGGTWRFDPHVGVDEDGVKVYTSMYKNLRTNTPRQTMEYAGFPFPESTPSYPAGSCFYRYLKLFAREFDLIKHIKFQSQVTSVKWAGGGLWNVTYTDTRTRSTITEQCDFVAVATGELTTPVWPKFEGQDLFRGMPSDRGWSNCDFVVTRELTDTRLAHPSLRDRSCLDKGKMIHSHDYKEPEAYRNRRLLVVGAGPSGLDMAVHLSNVTARLVHSHHLKYNQPFFGPNYVKKTDIKEFTSNGVIFEDGSFEEIDDVIFCTGFLFDHSFLDKSCGLTKTGKFILPLYRHVVNIKHPNMAFAGMGNKIINRVIDAQANYVAALAANKFQLPSQEEMLQDWLRHVYSLRQKRLKIVDVNTIGDQMDRYFGNLTEEAGVPRAPPVLTAIRDFNVVNRLEDLLNYRDYDYKIIDDYKYDRWYNPREGHPCPIEDF